MEKFSLILSVLLLHKSLVIAEAPPVVVQQKYSRTVMESSNNENLTVSPLTLFPDSKGGKEEQSNATWRSKEFSTKNVSELLTEYPQISRLSLLSNESRLFHALNATATLTIVVKQFKHALMYLNFSYYVGTVVEKPVTESSADLNITVEATKGANSSKNGPLTSTSLPKELVGSTTESAIQLKPLTATPMVKSISDSQPATSLNMSSNAPKNSSSDQLVDQTPEPIPIMHDMARRKRAVSITEEALPPAGATEPALDQTEYESGNDTGTTTPTSNSSTTEVKVDHSLVQASLVQAVEMIKTASAAISMVAAAPGLPTGHTDPLANAVPTKSNGVPVTETSNPIKETSDIPKSESKANVKNEDSLEDTGTAVPTTAETLHRHRHRSHGHKSKAGVGVANNPKSGNNKKAKGKKGKNARKDDKPERIIGKTNDDGEENQDNGSSSSSSSEEDKFEHEGGKKKISYKTWKASFEKKNRPPGLYVTVNDDIIFDNWEGLWDKHHVLGRWTGTNSKPLAEGMWNRTQLFMNWEDVPTNVVKITFEWEPMDDNSYLVLADIVVSTIGTTSCDSNPLAVLTAPPEIHPPSIVIIKQNPENSGAWQIIKMGKAGSAEVDNVNYKDLNTKQMDNMTQAKLIGQDGNDDLLKAVLKTLQADLLAATATSIKVERAVTLENGSATSVHTSSASTSSTLMPPLISTSAAIITTTPSTTTTTSTTTQSTTATPSTTATTQKSHAGAPVDNETSLKRQRNEDKESALLVSIVTGSIAMTILVLTLKKYFEISKKERINHPHPNQQAP